MDTPTRNRIAKLHPSVRNEVTKIIQECDTALTGQDTPLPRESFRVVLDNNESFY